jgi:hypothetical protein
MTSVTRLKNHINLRNFDKIINYKKTYFIISFLPDSITKINEFKYDLLLNNLYCFKIKNSIYKTLQSPIILNRFGKLSGTNYIIFPKDNTEIEIIKLINLFNNYKQLAFFVVGRIGNIFYDESRFKRKVEGNQQALLFLSLIKVNYSFLFSLLSMQQKHFFNKLIYIVQFICKSRRI